jgi:chloramphenicol O-acetyltransferase
MQLVRIVWHYSYINVNRWKRGRKFQNFKRKEKNPHFLSFYSFGQCLLNEGGF